MGGRDVLITGIGMVTPLGASTQETLAEWQSGAVAPCRPLPELAGTPLENASVATLPDLESPGDRTTRRMAKYMSGAAALGARAAREAVENAKLTGRVPAERVGLFAGAGLAAARASDVLPMIEGSIAPDGNFSCRLFAERGLPAANPLISFRILANMPPCIVSIIEGTKGPNYIFAPWEGQAACALIEAWRAVASGEVEAALAGSADDPAHPSTFVFLRQAGLLKPGEYPAPGAAYLVLEPADVVTAGGPLAHAHVADMQLAPGNGAVRDSLAARLGRSFAAAPSILMALAAASVGAGCGAPSRGVVCGVDAQEFRFGLEAT